MKLIATKSLRYAGRDLQAGDEFDASSDRDGRVLKAIRKATDAPEGVATTSVPSTIAPKPTPPKRAPKPRQTAKPNRGGTYQTRRLKAGD